MAEKPEIKVGGQAVMEGVMMRTPKSFSVAVRKQNGEIVLTESPWFSLWERYKFLRWPFLRGSVVLLESMMNGVTALQFSAKVAMADEQARQQKEKGPEISGSAPPAPKGDPQEAIPLSLESSKWAVGMMVMVGLMLGIGLFIALPHLAVWLGSRLMGRELDVKEFLFHLVVGGVKMGVFIGYIALISLMKDVRRLFMYHGAEHQSIYTYEAGQELTVENARNYSPLHPRCGTTFLIMVIAISILVFSLCFPLLLLWLGEPTGIKWLDQVIYIGIKLPLLFPIAGLAYEFQRLVSRHTGRRWARVLSMPGLWVQRLTTRPPSDDQLEVALSSLRMALWREKQGAAAEKRSAEIEVFENYGAVVRKLGQIHQET